MHNASVVRVGQPVGNGGGDVERASPRKSRRADRPIERFTVKQLHHRERDRSFGADVVEGDDIGMRERCDDACFPLESGERAGVVDQAPGDDLNGNVPP